MLQDFCHDGRRRRCGHSESGVLGIRVSIGHRLKGSRFVIVDFGIAIFRPGHHRIGQHAFFKATLLAAHDRAVRFGQSRVKPVSYTHLTLPTNREV